MIVAPSLHITGDATIDGTLTGGGAGGMAIGGTITDATAGSVLFVGTDGVLAQDALFQWDDAAAQHYQLKLGNLPTLQASSLQSGVFLGGNDGASGGPYVSLSTNLNNDPVRLVALGYLGTDSTAPAAVSAGYDLLRLEAQGYMSGSTIGLASRIAFGVDQDPTGGNVPGNILVSTSSTTGFVDRVLITSQGTTNVSSPDAGDAATQTVGTDGSAPASNDTVTVNGTVYTFKSALTPTDGEVLIVTGDADATLTNLLHAINASGGTPGTDYQVSGAHATVSADTTITSHHATLSARSAGAQGNSLTLAKSGTHLTVGGATFSGGRDGSTLVTAGKVEHQGDIVTIGGRNAATISTATFSLDPSSLVAHQQYTADITVAAMTATDLVVLVPPADLEAGLIWMAVPGSGKFTVTILNTTHSTIDGAAKTWRYFWLK
jgi:hypothetical protein